MGPNAHRVGVCARDAGGRGATHAIARGIPWRWHAVCVCIGHTIQGRTQEPYHKPTLVLAIRYVLVAWQGMWQNASLSLARHNKTATPISDRNSRLPNICPVDQFTYIAILDTLGLLSYILAVSGSQYYHK